MVSRRKGANLTYHTNAGAKGVWWEVAPECSLYNTRVSVRAGNPTEIYMSENWREAQKCKGGHVPPDNSDL